MSAADERISDVIIAGAGPTGLLLACELGLAGRTVVVLEQAADPRAAAKERPFGLRGLTVPSIEHFDRRGLLDPIATSGPRHHPDDAIRAEQERGTPGGHFAGIDFAYDGIDSRAWPYRLPGGIATMAADIATIETVLAARARALGVEILRGMPVTGVEQNADRVRVTAGDRYFHGRWLVGCDGGRSAVRKLAGVAFVGTPPEFTGYSLRVAFADMPPLTPGRALTPGGVVIFAPPDTLWIADYDGGAAHRKGALDRAHVERILRRVAGHDVPVASVEFAASWTDRACLAASFRNGRVLLAGDAAHIHSPLGGQGLNLGLGDAMNLGWKLAATLRGDAPEALLDSYDRERRPIAAQVLERSRAQVALLRPDPGSRALEATMTALIGTPDATALLAERVSGIGLRYDLGSSHPLIGRSVPDFPLADGSRVNEHLRDGSGLLLIAADGPPSVGSLPSPKLRRGMIADRGGIELTAALIRPDGIVAWAIAGEVEMDAFERAVTRWFARGDC